MFDMEAESFQDEVLVNFNDPTTQQYPRKPMHHNRKFQIAVGILLACIVGTIAGISFGNSSSSDSSYAEDILPGLSSDGPGSRNNVSPKDSFAGVPSPTTPTTSPTTKSPAVRPSTMMPTHLYDPPSNADCLSVAKGDEIPGQDGLLQQTFIITLDVVMSDGSTSNERNALAPELQGKIQTILMPKIVGCNKVDTRRNMRNRQFRKLVSSPFVVANARATVRADQAACSKSLSRSCFHLITTLDLRMNGSETPNALTTLILTAFGQEDDMVQRLQMSQNVEEVLVVSVNPDHTSSPTTMPVPMPSAAPTATAASAPTAQNGLTLEPTTQFVPIRFTDDDDNVDDDDDDDSDGDGDGDDEGDDDDDEGDDDDEDGDDDDDDDDDTSDTPARTRY